MATAMEEENYIAAPQDFRCPISMEVMKDPVTISTGITYERRHIERWLFVYKKKTCPATMQPLLSFDLTPNLTLKSLVLAWKMPTNSYDQTTSSRHEEIVSLLEKVESSPFKESYLKKLRTILEVAGDQAKLDFIKSGGVQVAIQIVVQILLPEAGLDSTTIAACEEALGLLHTLQLSDDDTLYELLAKPDSVKAMAMVLQRGSLEARLYVVTAFCHMSRADTVNWKPLIEGRGSADNFLGSLIELVSDDVSCRASSLALQVLLSIFTFSTNSRLKAIEAGITSVLVELLSDRTTTDSKCEKMLHLMKLLCECTEGRVALTEHGLGIAALSKRLTQGTHWETKSGVKIFWLIATNYPNKRVLEEMLMYGAVTKLFTLLHIDGRSPIKNKIIKIFRVHSDFWRVYPCFSLGFSFPISQH